MDRERILKLADMIEHLPDHPEPDTNGRPSGVPDQFNMGVWHCGTCACIGGVAEAMFLGTFNEASTVAVGEALGLSNREAHQLFYSPIGMSATAARAARCLRNLAETGKVDWDKALAA